MCKISVIVPVYKAEGTLETALSSVFMQTLTDIEILCINDGSTDHSRRRSNERPAQRRPRTVPYAENAGAGMARNKGIAEAKGEYIAFLDADDLYPGPYALETLLAAAEKAVPWSAAALLKKPRGMMCTPCLFSRRRAFITPAMSRSTVFSPALFIIAIFYLKIKLQFPPLRVYEDPIFLLCIAFKSQRITTPCPTWFIATTARIPINVSRSPAPRIICAGSSLS